MDRVAIQERRHFPGTFASFAVAFGLVLSGCSSVPDAVNPVEWAKSVGGIFDDNSQAADAKAKAERRPVPGADRPFPNLSSVPGRPAVTPVGDRERIAQGLRADRDNARYAEEVARVQPASVSIPGSASVLRPAGGQAATQASLSPAIPVNPTPPVRSADPVPPVAAAVPVRPTASTATAAPRMPVAREVLRAQAVEPAAGGAASSTSGNSSPSVSAVPAVPPPAAVPEPQATAPAAPRAAERQFASRTTAGRGAVSDAVTQGVSYRAAVIYFDQDSSSLSPEDIAAIREVARFHRETGGQVRIIGHAAGDGAAAGGQRLRDATVRVSSARAEAVARQLVQYGVPQRSVVVRGVGEGEPMVRDGSADAAARNRRAEVYIDY